MTYTKNPTGELLKEINTGYIEANIEVLQNYFESLREYGGIPIMKDNCEDLFENWLEDTEYSELVKIIKSAND